MAEKRTKTKAPDARRNYVRNRSQRLHGVKPRAILIHSTESADLPDTQKDLDGIESWFNNPASQASSHIGIDGDANTRVWVPAEEKAWTAGAANSWSLNIEFIARAAQSAKEWEVAQVKTGAKWCAYWSIRFGIPLQRANIRNINGLCVCTKSGVGTHFDVTKAGFGNHTDPGANFPMEDLLSWAQWYKRNGWYTHLTEGDRRR